MRNAAILALVLLLAACGRQQTGPTVFRTPEGEEFTVSKASLSDDKKAVAVTVLPPAGMKPAEMPALSDRAFRGLAGPAAENAKVSQAAVEVGPYDGRYRRDEAGRWTRADGETAPALEQVGRVAMPDGTELVTTSSAIHDLELFVVYYCANCSGPDAPLRAAGALYDLQDRLRAAAAAANVRQFHASVFAAPRRTAWEFSAMVYLSGKRDDKGGWDKPALTRREFVDAIARKLHPQ